ncbi:MAG: hypothetical protein ACPLVJ_01355 [Candidatus Bathyarchaeales archaeon]
MGGAKRVQAAKYGLNEITRVAECVKLRVHCIMRAKYGRVLRPYIFVFNVKIIHVLIFAQLMLYTQLVNFKNEDGFVCKVASTSEEIAQLVEAGFEYVCEHNGAKFFRKRK